MLQVSLNTNRLFKSRTRAPKGPLKVNARLELAKRRMTGRTPFINTKPLGRIVTPYRCYRTHRPKEINKKKKIRRRERVNVVWVLHKR